VLYLYMESAQRSLASRSISKVFFWRRIRPASAAAPTGLGQPRSGRVEV
jgi:hypothetical protein